MEYLIEITENGNVMKVILVERDKTISQLTPSENNYKYCTKFKSKDRAIKIASKVPNARVVTSFGGYVNSSKSTVLPVQGKVNKTSPYRTI